MSETGNEESNASIAGSGITGETGENGSGGSVVEHDGMEPTFDFVLEHILGMTSAKMRSRLHKQGISSAADMSLVDIDTILDCFTSTTAPNAMLKMKLKALKAWIDVEVDVRGYGGFDIRNFTADHLRTHQRRLATKGSGGSAHEGGGRTEAYAPSSKTLEFDGKQQNWMTAKNRFVAKLNQMKNGEGLPLYYVIRESDQEDEYRTQHGEMGNRVYDAPLQGNVYKRDAFRVLQMLREWTAQGTASTYCENASDVIDAWTTLLDIFEGKDAKQMVINRARSTLNNAHYTRDSPNFSFSDYCTKIIRANNDLNRHKANVDPVSQVTSFLRGIKADASRNPQLMAIKTSVALHPECKSDLRKAIETFKQLMLQVGMPTDGSGTNRRHVGGQNSGGRGGGRGRNRGQHRGGGRGHGRQGGQSGGGGGNRNNDMFIPDHVLAQLTPMQKKMMFKGRAQLEQEGNTQSGGTGRNVGAAETANDSWGTPIGGNKETNEDGDDANREDKKRPASVRFTSNADKKNKGIKMITSGTRHVGKAAKFKAPCDYEKRARAEIDSRADTVCGGATFKLVEDTGKVVNVSGFHPELQSLTGVKVGTLATAVDLEGETVIAVFHEGLYFGESMEHSLIPPAQLWDNGITVDITPKSKSNGKSIHGIYAPRDDVYIPFSLHGCISYFSSRLPTQEEEETCRWIHMTSEAEWDPYSDHFGKDEQAAESYYKDPFLAINRPTVDIEGNELNREGFKRYVSAVSTNVLEEEEHLEVDVDGFDHCATRMLGGTSSKMRRNQIPVETLARRWAVSQSTAQQTIRTTTQRGVRYLQGPLTRRFRTRQKQLQTSLLNTKVFSDTAFNETTSVRGHTCAQLFVTAEGFTFGETMKTKGDAYLALDRFCKEVGVPRLLVTDGAREELYGEWERIVKYYLIPTRVTEPYSGWQNRCETEIGEIKKHYSRVMELHHCPTPFWCFAWQYVLGLRQLIARRAAGNRPPGETIRGETQDISEYMDFDFYQWIIYRDQSDADAPRRIGRWLGVSHTVGAPLTYWILKDNAQIISRSTVQPMTVPEKVQFEAQRRAMDDMIKEKYGDFDPTRARVFDHDDMEDPLFPVTGDNGEEATEKEDEDKVDKDDEVEGPSAFGNAEIFLPHGDRNEIAKVVGRKRNADGNFVGRKHSNPMLDSRIFTVRFPDGDEKDVAYNILAEQLYSQVDEEGNQYHLFQEIVGHRRLKTALDKADQFRINKDGKRIKKKTTSGWDLEVEWKDGTTSWLPLRELKETNAVEVAQYAIDNRLEDEPAFDWWVRQVLKKRQRLIKLSRKRSVRKGYKFGIKLPKDVNEALQLDKDNGNTLWYDAIMKEMTNVMIAFEVKEKGAKPPPGFKPVDLMMVFDIKMDFTRKARMCARGDLTAPPATATYSSVVSRESVRIAFLLAALNEVDILMFDIGNAYLTAPAAEKLYVREAGKEFGEHQGKMMIVRRALYGLKSSGAAYRNDFAQVLRDLGFVSCYADADVWRRPAVKANGEKYYEYLLTYVDDCLVVSEHPRKIIDILRDEYEYRIKDDEPPSRYLGATTGLYDLGDRSAWFMSAQGYLEKAIGEVERKWGPMKKLFGDRSKLDIPVAAGYHPELDQSRILDDDETQLYQSYIGIIRWAVELGRIDLAHAAGVMARFSACPREGHLAVVLKMFAYCKKHNQSKIVFDPRYADMDGMEWANYDWKEFYPDVRHEILPPRMPEPRGRSVRISMFCDAAHASCAVTRRSTTGIIFFVNRAPISWYSKRQNTIESSVFGSEFVAMKIAIEQNEALRYKLRMMGVPIDGPTSGFGDNKSVITNVTIPQSTLQKKHNMIAYHKVRESVASDAIRLHHEPGKFNMSDALTKFLAAPAFRQCCEDMMYR